MAGASRERQPDWKRRFDEPIPLPDGRRLKTLREAADYITSLPPKVSAGEEWQAAIFALMLVAKSRTGPTMLARIGMMRALHRHDPPKPINPSPKNTHWAKRKLLRDR